MNKKIDDVAISIFLCKKLMLKLTSGSLEKIVLLYASTFFCNGLEKINYFYAIWGL